MLRNRGFLFFAIFVLCSFHVLALMGHSIREGRLAMVPVYDDVTYLVDGLERLDVLDRGGIRGLLGDFFVHPAHAPLIALSAALGFLLSAGETWGAYMANAMWVFVFVGLALVVLRGLDIRSRAGIAAAMLAVPMFGWTVAEFRPDPVWGLLVGFTVALLITVDLARTTTKRHFLLGLLIGLAIIAKPTAAPASLAVITVAWASLALASFALLKPISKRQLLRNALAAALGTVLIAGPYFFTSASEIYAYIKMVMSPENNVWRTQTDFIGHVTYYLDANFGRSMLGWIWYAAVPVFALGGLVVVRSRDRRALCALISISAALVAAYTIVTASAVKSPMIGSILYGTIIGATLWSIGQITRFLPIRHEAILVAGVVVFLLQWSPNVGMVQRADPAMRTTDDATKAAFPVVADALRTHTSKCVVVTVPGPVYSGSLDYLARQAGITGGTFHEGYTWKSWEQFTHGIGTCNVIVLSDLGMRGQALGYNFPSLVFQARAQQFIRTGEAFREHRVYTDSEGRSVWVYVRKGG